MRSPFRSLLLSVGLALMISACATFRDEEPAPAASPGPEAPGEELRAPAVSTLPEDAPEPEPVEPDVTRGPADVPAEPADPAVEHTTEPEPPPVVEQPPVRDLELPPPESPREPAPAPEAEPESPFVFNVRSEPKDESHPYYGVGHRLGFTVNGVQGKPVVVVRGETYTFRVNTNIQHDFYISRSPVGWGAATFTQGVTGQFIYDGAVTFKPTDQTPDLLYYQCRNHRNMGGPIYVVDADEADLPLAELQARYGGVPAGAQGQRPAAAPPAAQAERPVSEQQARQRLQFANMFINESSAATRIVESENPMALELHGVAKENYEAAVAALEGGDPAEALRLAEDAMRLMSEASLQVPQETQGEAQRARFEELYESVQSFESSYRRNYEQAVKTQGRGKVREVDLRRIQRVLDNARSLADDGEYNQAISMLGTAQQELTSALNEMLANQTIVHELNFETPQDEYEYELARYLGYESLIPLAIEQRRPSEDTMRLMNQFIDRAREVKALSEPEAEKGNYEEAILMLQGATSNIQRALQAAGVR